MLWSESEPLVRQAGAAAIDVLRDAIIDGRLGPGRRLKEEELARELGISRTPVREALRVLAAEGLVQTAPNRGARVRTHSVKDLDDLYQLRAMLEGYAARLAASRLSDEVLGDLRASCERFDDLLGQDGLDLGELVSENVFFHGTILAAAENTRLATMVRSVTELPLVYRLYVWYSPDQQRISGQYHHELTRALEARDGDRAEMLMKAHILAAGDTLVEHVRELEATP